MPPCVHRFALCRTFMHDVEAARTRAVSPCDVTAATRAPVVSQRDREINLSWLTHIEYKFERGRISGAPKIGQAALAVGGTATLLATFTLVPSIRDMAEYHRKRKTGSMYRRRSVEGVRENMVVKELELLNRESAGICGTASESVARQYLTQDEIHALVGELRDCANKTHQWVTQQTSARLRGSIRLAAQLRELGIAACLLSAVAGSSATPPLSITAAWQQPKLLESDLAGRQTT